MTYEEEATRRHPGRTRPARGVLHRARPLCHRRHPPPYTVTADGVTLTDGSIFPAHGHVNWRTNLRSGGTHFDPNNNQPGGAFIGKTFFPIDLAPGECLTWVQYSETGYHFGENGEAPICKPTSTPEPEPTSTPDPEPTATPDPEPTATPDPEPTSTPAPEQIAAPEPSTAPVALATSTSPSAQVADAPPAQVERLAATGIRFDEGRWVGWLVLGGLALLLGTFVLMTSTLNRRAAKKSATTPVTATAGGELVWTETRLVAHELHTLGFRVPTFRRIDDAIQRAMEHLCNREGWRTMPLAIKPEWWDRVLHDTLTSLDIDPAEYERRADEMARR